jgi:hypothetical protein
LVELKTKGAHAPSKAGAAGRRRLVLSGEDILCRGEEAARWAALNQIDALVLPFREGGSVLARLRGLPRRARQRLLLAAERYELIIEAGGWDLSFFVPRRSFWIRRELFRMVSGKRRRDLNFCPTNPDTIALLKVRAEKFFRAWPGVEVFHLWPGRSSGSPWCSCPSCRAFSPREQNRVAVNAAADVLLGINPAALVSFYEEAAGEGEGGTIPLRPNLFALEKLPGDEGAAGEGLFSLPPETAPGKHR